MKRHLLYLSIALSACSGGSEVQLDAGQPDLSPDVGFDGGTIDANNNDTTMEPDSSSESRCARGTYYDAELDICNGLAGCSAFTLVRDDLGCVFFPDTLGYLTTAECETNEDCADSEYGPNCILRVCHENPPCETDEDCTDGLVCLKWAICLPPRSTCESDDDCQHPGVCRSDGLCG